jgi:hypothetical protein
MRYIYLRIETRSLLFCAHLLARDERHLNISICLRFSVLEEGFEIWELIQCSSGARFDFSMKLATDAAEEAECHDEE